jgi:hypothetical protein
VAWIPEPIGWTVAGITLVAGLAARIKETDMVKKIKEHPPFMQPNGVPGKFEVNWRHLIEQTAPLLLVALLCFVGGSLWALTIRDQNRDMLAALKNVDKKVDDRFSSLNALVDARDARQQRAIVSVGKLMWNHLFPKQPCPLDMFEKTIVIDKPTPNQYDLHSQGYIK